MVPEFRANREYHLQRSSWRFLKLATFNSSTAPSGCPPQTTTRSFRPHDFELLRVQKATGSAQSPKSSPNSMDVASSQQQGGTGTWESSSESWWSGRSPGRSGTTSQYPRTVSLSSSLPLHPSLSLCSTFLPLSSSSLSLSLFRVRILQLYCGCCCCNNVN